MSRRNLIWMAIILCLAGLAALLAHRQPEVAPSDPAIDDLAPALEAYELIQAHGYADFPPERAWQGAIEGMARRVDEYSRYLSPGQADQLDVGLTGTHFGTGLRITESAGRLVTVGALPGSPADLAGIGAGLEVLAIDGVEARYFSLEQARPLVRRPVGGEVELRLRERGGETVVRRLVAGPHAVPSVTGLVRDADGEWVHALDPEAGIHYLRVTEFTERRSTQEFHEAYRRLARPRGIVLDLRGNPGGYLQAAAVLVDRFLDGGVIVRTVTRKGDEYVHHAHPAGTYPPVPLVVLVNGRTASAAEIAAGALQAHGRAVLIGRPTRGKFHVQSQFALGGGRGSLVLTTARYFLGAPATRPATRPVTQPATAAATRAGGTDRRAGIRPDVDVRLTASARRELALLRARAMVAPSPPAATDSAPADGPPAHERLRDAILAADAQLAEAVALLKRRLAAATRPAGRGGEARP